MTKGATIAESPGRNDQEEDQPSGTIPYMAPEFLENKNVSFTEKTEVYSFGVLLWEIFSDPRRAKKGPYPNMQPVQILFQVINNGLRPYLPGISPPDQDSMDEEEVDTDISTLMQCCWQHSPSERPTFANVIDYLQMKINQQKETK